MNSEKNVKHIRFDCSKSIESLQNYVSIIENIFFRIKDETLEVSRLDPSNDNYDSSYDIEVRRKELCVIHMLDEMCEDQFYENCYDILLNIEDLVLTPEFYRNVLFGRIQSQVFTLFDNVTNLLEEKVHYIYKNFNPKKFESFLKRYNEEYAFNESTFNEFLLNVGSIKTFLIHEKQKLKQIS